eukprot:3808230-Amphidinium_carterae.1
MSLFIGQSLIPGTFGSHGPCSLLPEVDSDACYACQADDAVKQLTQVVAVGRHMYTSRLGD